ncbi:MAG: hypothetical protein U0528_19920 [Anaerolineae bacterium]
MDQATSVQRPAIVPLVSNRDNGLKRRQTISSLMTILLALLTFSAVAILFIITDQHRHRQYLFTRSDFIRYVSGRSWYRQPSRERCKWHLSAALIAVPLGIMSAVYLSEFGGGARQSGALDARSAGANALHYESVRG